MKKSLLWAFLLMAITVLVLIFNKGSVSVDLPFHFTVSGLKSIVFLVFVSIGLAIGVLLK
jgi:hypothetical protein